MYRKTLQTSVAAAALFAFTAAYTAPASADNHLTKSGQKKASLTVSGQVNRAIQIADDGTNSALFHVDNDLSSTRVRWVAKGNVTGSFSTGALIEMQIESNTSSGTNIAGKEAPNANTENFGVRKLEAWLSHRSVGKLTLGQGDPASNSTSEVSLSGMSPGMYSGLADFAGGQVFRLSNQLTTTATNRATGPSIGALWGNQHDGRSRTDRIRYDSPNYAGFRFSASHEQGDLWDVALRHAGKFGQFKTSAAIAYVDWDQINSVAGTAANAGLVGTKGDQVNGSVSVLHDSGLNVTVSAGSRDNDGIDNLSGAVNQARASSDHIYVMLGYIAKLTNLGTTRFAIDWGQANDLDSNDSEITSIGIGVLQNFKEIGTDVYAVFRNYEAEQNVLGVAQNFDDVNVFMAGARVKF